MPPTITETIASIFSAPPRSILLHACNAKGSWGAGVAAAFKSHYPSAFKIYRAHCVPPSAKSNCALRAHQQSLVGTTLLIPPQSPSSSSEDKDGGGDEESSNGRHWIACLFTSHGFGRAVSGAEEILDATRSAMADLEQQIEVLKKKKGPEEVGKCWAVRINSGKFGVEWRRTRRVLEEGGLDVVVVRREEDEDGDAGAGAKGEVKVERKEGQVKKDDGDDGAGGEKRKKGKNGRDEEGEVGVERAKKGRAARGEGLMSAWLKQK